MENVQAAFMTVVAQLAKKGVRTTVEVRDGILAASFQDGFYKSDGCTYLQPDDGRLYLHARYNEKTEVNSYQDIIQCSYDWYQRSKERFHGWSTPPSNWAALYAEIH